METCVWAIIHKKPKVDYINNKYPNRTTGAFVERSDRGKRDKREREVQKALVRCFFSVGAESRLLSPSVYDSTRALAEIERVGKQLNRSK